MDGTTRKPSPRPPAIGRAFEIVRSHRNVKGRLTPPGRSSPGGRSAGTGRSVLAVTGLRPSRRGIGRGGAPDSSGSSWRTSTSCSWCCVARQATPRGLDAVGSKPHADTVDPAPSASQGALVPATAASDLSQKSRGNFGARRRPPPGRRVSAKLVAISSRDGTFDPDQPPRSHAIIDSHGCVGGSPTRFRFPARGGLTPLPATRARTPRSPSLAPGASSHPTVTPAGSPSTGMTTRGPDELRAGQGVGQQRDRTLRPEHRDRGLERGQPPPEQPARPGGPGGERGDVRGDDLRRGERRRRRLQDA